jgi:hypothetical protein
MVIFTRLANRSKLEAMVTKLNKDFSDESVKGDRDYIFSGHKEHLNNTKLVEEFGAKKTLREADSQFGLMYTYEDIKVAEYLISKYKSKNVTPQAAHNLKAHAAEVDSLLNFTRSWAEKHGVLPQFKSSLNRSNQDIEEEKKKIDALL